MAVSVRRVLVEGPAQKQFSYSSTPKALYNNSKLRKNPSCGDVRGTGGRLARGSTFAAHAHAAGDGSGPNPAGAVAAGGGRARRLARKAANARLRPGSPPPAPGRRHLPVQTERYLEELFEKGVELEVGVQTDLFVDRPATPVYVPAKHGRDQHTQIYAGDLFDFEVEVRALVDTLVAECGGAALREAAREEELATLRHQQRRFRELRDAERAERTRLARQEDRLQQEAKRRVAEASVAAEAAQEARRRAAAAALAQGYAAELLPAVLGGLRAQGYLVERLRRGVTEEFVPWLTAAVAQEVEAVLTGRQLLTDLLREVVAARAELLRGAGERAALRGNTPDPPTPPSRFGEEQNESELEE